MSASSSEPGSTARTHTTAEWWHEAVVYHVYLPSFRDSDGDGVGDLEGVIQSLPYLAETLGVDAVWISPFFVSPWLDGGYDIADHTAVESRFGDLETFERLVSEAHRNGVRVIVDYVPNHTSDRHRWFVQSRSSRENCKRDWYVWADPRPDGSPPNNWVSEAGGSAWELDVGTGQYFLHSHLVEQPDLNWRNPEVRAAMFDVLRFWLQRGVDGVRVDVAHMLMKDPELRDNPANPHGTPNPYERQHPDFTTQLHVNDRRHPDLHGVLRELRGVLNEYGDRVAIGELDVMPWPEWASYYGDALDELHLPMNFSLIETPWTADAVRSALAELERALPPGAWPVNHLGNHDRSRVASRLGPAQARIAAMLLLTARGTPILYYGDELGMTDVDVPAERARDGYARLDGGPTRDPNRTPMPWGAEPQAGFAPPNAQEPWLPLGADWPQRNVRRQLGDESSPLTLYRRLIATRRARSSLRSGGLRLLDTGPSDCLVFERADHRERSLIALNFTDELRTIPVPGPGARILLSSTLRPGIDTASIHTEIVLSPNEGVICEPRTGAHNEETEER